MKSAVNATLLGLLAATVIFAAKEPQVALATPGQFPSSFIDWTGFAPLTAGSGVTITGTWPNQTIAASGGSIGGASGQVQYNNAGSFGGFTVGGDGTLNTSTGALTISKTGGVAFGPLATLAPGSGVPAWLITPNSANLAAALTDETGTGQLVFGTGPAIDLTNATGLPTAGLVNNAVTNAKAAQMAAKTIKGNATGSLANAGDLSVAQVKALLGGLAPSVIDYGADNTNTTDSALAFNNAFAAVLGSAPGGQLDIPCGHYKVLSGVSASIPSNSNLTVIGGGQDCALVDFVNGNGFGVVHADYTSSENWSGLSALTGTATAGKTAFTLTQTTPSTNPALTAVSSFTNVTTRGNDGYGATNYWANGYNVTVVSNITWDKSGWFGNSGKSGNGVQLSGSASGCSGPCYAVVYNFTNDTCDDNAIGIAELSNVQGIAISTSNFTTCTSSIYVPASETGLGELNITMSQFGQSSINILSPGFGGSIIGNYFVNTGSNTSIYSNGQYMVISGNYFGATIQAGANAIILNSGAINNVVQGNIIYNYTSGIWMTSGANNNQVLDNQLVSNVTPITNSGTGNRVINNIGYNPVGTTAAANVGASPATITAGASPETHYIKQSASFNATVAKGGQTVCGDTVAAVPCVIQLGPGESYVVTWTTTQPTYVKDVH